MLKNIIRPRMIESIAPFSLFNRYTAPTAYQLRIKHVTAFPVPAFASCIETEKKTCSLFLKNKSLPFPRKESCLSLIIIERSLIR